MLIRAEVVASLGDACRNSFLARVCALIRSEFEEFEEIPAPDLLAFVDRAIGRAECAGILEERNAAEFALLTCSWSAMTGHIDFPRWFEPILSETGLDGTAKLRRLLERSRIEALPYGEIVQE